MSFEKPTLPSLQLVLKGAGISHHGRSRSDVSSEFKNDESRITPMLFNPTPLYQSMHSRSGRHRRAVSTSTVEMMLQPTHSNNKYTCQYCHKGFSRPSSLRIHTYSHTGEKPFECPSCDRAFSVQSNMRRHIKVHQLNAAKPLKIRPPPSIKPLAAKPSWMHDTFCC